MGKYLFTDNNLVDTFSQNISNVKEINVSTITGVTEFENTDSDDITIKIYFGNKNHYSRFDFNAGTLNDAFNISLKPKFFLSLMIPKILIKIYVPNKFNGIVNISSTSGEISSSLKNLKSFYISQTSGDILLTDTKSEILEIHSSSGKINLKDIEVAKLNINSISGKINCYCINTNNSLYNNSSINIASTSGSIDCKVTGYYSEIYINNISGGIDLFVPDEYDYSCTTNSISGKVTVEESTNKNSELRAKIALRNTSGHIYLRNH